MISMDSVPLFCKNYENILNYEYAIADETQTWDCHHRREIDENKSVQLLKEEGKYYDVNPEDLVFLPKSCHMRVHFKNRLFSEETRKKMSKNHADVSGENNPNYGNHNKKGPQINRTKRNWLLIDGKRVYY